MHNKNFKPRPTIFLVPNKLSDFFTGRDEDLKSLRKMLIKTGRAAITQSAVISGFGGIGKTQTALAYCHRNRADYSAVFWARADKPENLLSDFASFARHLNIKLQQKPDDTAGLVKRWMESNGGWLLVLDNAESVRDFGKYLPQRQGCHLLVTSRARDFAGIGILEPYEIKVLEPARAVEFLLTRTGREKSGAAEKKAAGEIAKELGFLPLALEQAGAYIKVSGASFPGYLGELKKGAGILKRRGPATGDYPNSVHTTWKMNFDAVKNISLASADLLDALKKKPLASADLLNVLAFLPPDRVPFEIFLKGSKKLGGEIEKAVDSEKRTSFLDILIPLADYSLISRDLKERTLSIHRMIQAVIRDEMNETTQKAWAERTMEAVNAAFPPPDFEYWPICERLAASALACFELIEKFGLISKGAARLINEAGLYFHIRAQYAQAEPLMRKALEIDEKSYGPDDPDVAIRLSNLAQLLYDTNRLAEAEPLMRRALEIDEKSHGPDHPEVAIDLNNLAQLLYDTNRRAEAEPLMRRALEIDEKSNGPDHPNVAIRLNNLAILLYDTNRLDEAEPLMRRALEIGEKSLGPDHPNVAIRLSNLGGLEAEKGNLKEAGEHLSRALEIFRASYRDENHPHVQKVLSNIAFLAILKKAKKP